MIENLILWVGSLGGKFLNWYLSTISLLGSKPIGEQKNIGKTYDTDSRKALGDPTGSSDAAELWSPWKLAAAKEREPGLYTLAVALTINWIWFALGRV